MILTAYLLAASLAGASCADAGQPQTVHIIKLHVATKTTATSTFVEPEQKDLADSVRDLADILDKQVGLRVAPKAEADLTITVLARARRPRSNAVLVVPNGAGGFIAATKRRTNTMLLVELAAGDYRREIVAEAETNFWKDAALEMAAEVRKWIDLNREALVSRRTSGKLAK